ncbi:hypothetical protein [Acinetobacter rudis]|uniref:hypothetical protein n=1 Tax=Acinetobacter rudis TaxID=632955 RepID=UPI003341C542
MHQETFQIAIDDDKQVIQFSRKIQKKECAHKHIQISEEDNEVLCTDCNTSLNPIWWIKTYLKHLNSTTTRNNRMLSEAQAIWVKLEKKNKFACKHCHEVNTIDFKKLPSQAAITRGITVLDQEHEGFKVVVE